MAAGAVAIPIIPLQQIGRKNRQANQQAGGQRFSGREDEDPLLPAPQVSGAQLPTDIHQDQRQGNIGNQAQFVQCGEGYQIGQMENVGKRRADQQTGQQIAGDPWNPAECRQSATDQGSAENDRKGNYDLKIVTWHSGGKTFPR